MSAPVAIAQTALALELRAGASDTDRPAWLAQRMSGITGTEIRDLYLGATRVDDLVALKLGRKTSNFSGNAYTRWGNEREVVIAELLLSKYGIEPETRLFRAADNERFLVSPDGTGETIDGELLGSEIKTAGVDIAPGSKDFAKKGYLFQMMWGMRVTGARRWLYAWEPRIEVAPFEYEPGELHVHWIDYDEALAAELEVIAVDFLAALDAARATEYVAPDVDDVIDTHAVNYLRFIELEKEAAVAKKAEYDAILEVVGERESFQQEGSTARVTLTPMKLGTRPEVDADGARAARPDLYEAMVEAEALWAAHLANHTAEVQTETKPRLTITTIKKGQS